MVQTRSKGHTATSVVCYRMGLAAESMIAGADGGPRCFDYTRRSGIAATGWGGPAGDRPELGRPRHVGDAASRRSTSARTAGSAGTTWWGSRSSWSRPGRPRRWSRTYAARLAVEHKTVVHFALHRPARGGKNHHAHVLYPGRHVEGLTFSRKRDRTQDNPGKGGVPDLITRHKAIWSELCRGRGLELDWTTEAPGHHLGPALCAVKRARLVEDTRETIRETVAASRPGKPVPGERTPAGGGRDRQPGQ